MRVALNLKSGVYHQEGGCSLSDPKVYPNETSSWRWMDSSELPTGVRRCRGCEHVFSHAARRAHRQAGPQVTVEHYSAVRCSCGWESAPVRRNPGSVWREHVAAEHPEFLSAWNCNEEGWTKQPPRTQGIGLLRAYPPPPPPRGPDVAAGYRTYH